MTIKKKKSSKMMIMTMFMIIFFYIKDMIALKASCGLLLKLDMERMTFVLIFFTSGYSTSFSIEQRMYVPHCSIYLFLNVKTLIFA